MLAVPPCRKVSELLWPPDLPSTMDLFILEITVSDTDVWSDIPTGKGGGCKQVLARTESPGRREAVHDSTPFALFQYRQIGCPVLSSKTSHLEF